MSKKPSQSLTERNIDGVNPLFNQKGDIIGMFRRGRITLYKNGSSSLAATSTNRLNRDKSLTELLGGPL